MEPKQSLSNALWRIYNRPARPRPWAYGGNLPWDEPEFSQRMLAEHLDETHGAASRTSAERAAQLAWFKTELQLEAGKHLLDVTCGPGLYAVPLAEAGIEVSGVDFSPAAIAHAKELAETAVLSHLCHFYEEDVRKMTLTEQFDAALLLYGQLAVFTKAEAFSLLKKIAKALKPNGRLLIELLNQERVDKENSNWWYTDEAGLWGNTPYLHLGERFWQAEEAISIERFHILHLENGRLDEITLCDQTYAMSEMVNLLKTAGFRHVTPHVAWAGLPLYDAEEWIVYVAEM